MFRFWHGHGYLRFTIFVYRANAQESRESLTLGIRNRDREIGITSISLSRVVHALEVSPWRSPLSPFLCLCLCLCLSVCLKLRFTRAMSAQRLERTNIAATTVLLEIQLEIRARLETSRERGRKKYGERERERYGNFSSSFELLVFFVKHRREQRASLIIDEALLKFTRVLYAYSR